MSFQINKFFRVISFLLLGLLLSSLPVISFRSRRIQFGALPAGPRAVSKSYPLFGCLMTHRDNSSLQWILTASRSLRTVLNEHSMKRSFWNLVCIRSLLLIWAQPSATAPMPMSLPVMKKLFLRSSPGLISRQALRRTITA